MWDGRRTRTHPAPWELDVQSWIRSTTLSSDEAMLVGSDSHGLAAVVAWAEIDGPSSILLQALAVAVRHRGAGGEVAREAVSVAFGEIRERAERFGSSSIVVETRIDRRNRSSRRLAGAVGFIRDVEIGPDLERWLYVEDLSPSTSP